MPALLQRLVTPVVWGTLFGVAVGGWNILAERYLELGLTRLALQDLARSAGGYLTLGLIGWAAASMLRAGAARAEGRLGPAVQTVLRLGAWLATALPVFVWIGVGDAWPTSAGKLWRASAGLGLAALLSAAGLIWGRAPRAIRRPSRVRFALAGACALAVGGLLVLERVAAHSSAPRPNVLLVVLDTVRADRLSSYGYPRPTTPELDAFAEEAIRFTRFYSTSSWTVPSHASLFTGLLPARHQATQETLHLDRRFATLAEALRNSGYRTFGASANPFVGRLTNLSQGFEDFEETWRRSLAQRTLDRVAHPNNASFASFLARTPRSRPFFAFLNYMEAHHPYAPPEPHLSRFLDARSRGEAGEVVARRWTRHYLGQPYSERDLRVLSDLYDGELAHLSTLVGEALAMLRRDGRYDETLIAITSDHGEHFGENGLLEHVFGLYNTTVQVPLLLRPPGGTREGEVSAREGQLTDLFLTILDATGTEAPRGVPAGSDLLGPAPSPGSRAIVSEYYLPAQVLSVFDEEELSASGSLLRRYLRRLRAIQLADRRFIWSSDGRHELYDLSRDPAETHNLYDAEKGAEAIGPYLDRLESELGIELESTAGDRPNAPEVPTDEATRAALRALGYLR
ncbi:MAG: sulfatase [Myxococcota bacterium]